MTHETGVWKFRPHPGASAAALRSGLDVRAPRKYCPERAVRDVEPGSTDDLGDRPTVSMVLLCARSGSQSPASRGGRAAPANRGHPQDTRRDWRLPPDKPCPERAVRDTQRPQRPFQDNTFRTLAHPSGGGTANSAQPRNTMPRRAPSRHHQPSTRGADGSVPVPSAGRARQAGSARRTSRDSNTKRWIQGERLKRPFQGMARRPEGATRATHTLRCPRFADCTPALRSGALPGAPLRTVRHLAAQNRPKYSRCSQAETSAR